MQILAFSNKQAFLLGYRARGFGNTKRSGDAVWGQRAARASPIKKAPKRFFGGHPI
jgi:hypothetical protein